MEYVKRDHLSCEYKFEIIRIIPNPDLSQICNLDYSFRIILENIESILMKPLRNM